MVVLQRISRWCDLHERTKWDVSLNQIARSINGDEYVIYYNKTFLNRFAVVFGEDRAKEAEEVRKALPVREPLLAFTEDEIEELTRSAEY